MRRPNRGFRSTVMAAVVLMVAIAMPGLSGSAAAQAYDPVPWDPPAGHNVTTVRWGPIPLPAAENGEPGHVDNEIAVDGRCNPLIDHFQGCRSIEMPKPCENCYITGIMPDLVYAGTDVSVNMNTGGMLHHVVNVNLSRPDPTCRPGLRGLIRNLGLIEGGNERFFAAGNERTLNTLYTAGDYGYRVDSGDRWALIYHLMNMNPQPVEVEFKYTFSWVRAATEVDPIWLDIDQCGDSEVSIGAGYTDRHWETRTFRSGTLVAIGGHAHNHSIAVSLENATRNRYPCESVAGYAPGSPHVPAGEGPGTPGHPAGVNTVTSTGHPNAPLEAYMGHISDFSVCEPNTRFGLFDKIRMHTSYYHPTGTDDAMGIMVAFVT